MDIVDFGTPFGLAFASGLNAYLPLLAFSLSTRWLHLYRVHPQFDFITQSWFIAALAILALLDFVADKMSSMPLYVPSREQSLLLSRAVMLCRQHPFCL